MDKPTRESVKASMDDHAEVTDALVEFARHPGADSIRELYATEVECITTPVYAAVQSFADKGNTEERADQLVADMVAASGSRIAFMPFAIKAVEIGITAGRRVRVFVNPAKRDAPEVIITEVRDQ